MSNFENTDFSDSTEIFPSYTPEDSQSSYFPYTVQENVNNYQQTNSFGYFHQDYVPENSYQYFDNGYQSSESENDVIYHPVINQVYVPESHLYKVVHAVVFHGTTYFYESLVDYPVYRLYNTITYSPDCIVDGNSSYTNWPGEISHTNEVDEYIETTPEIDYHSNFVENLTTENNEYLSRPMNMSPFYSPEMFLGNSSYYNYWNATHVSSESDIVDNFDSDTSSAIRQENLMHSSEIYQNRYSENIFTQNEDDVYYERVNSGCSQLGNDFNLEGGSVQDPVQATVHSLEALAKNAIQAHVKYRKDSMYLTALSGKLYQKESIPVVEKMPDITEVEDEYRMIDCSNKAIENNKSLVQVNTCIKYSKKLYRSKSIPVSESVTEMENSTNDDHMISRSIEKLSKTKQQIDLAVGENVFANRCKKMYRKESCLFVKNVHLIKEVSDTCKVTESSIGILPQMERTYSVIEEKIFVKQTEELIRNQDFREMPVIQEADDEDELVESSNVNIPKTRQSIFQANIFTRRSRNMYRKERYQVFEKMPAIEEIHDEGDLAQPSKERLLERKNSVVRTNIFNDRAKKSYEKESFEDFEKMLVMKEVENEDYVDEYPNRRVSKRKQTDPNVKKDAFSVKLHTEHNITDIGKMPSVQETDKHHQIDKTNEIVNKGHLKEFQIEQLNTDTDKDSDGFLDKNKNIEKNLFAQENGFLSKTIEIPQAEKTDAGNILYSMDVGKSSMINDERYSLNRCQGTKDFITLVGNNTAESTSLSPLWVEVDLNETLETATANGSENEPDKVHSQKPKKKRFENFRKFLERLLCCCTKGPT